MRNIEDFAKEQLQEEDLRVTTDMFDIDILYSDYGGSREHINDVVNDIIESNSPIYDSELFDVFQDLYYKDYLDRAISEFGANNMESILRGGYDLYLTDIVYDSLNAMIKYYIFSTLEEYAKEVASEEFEDILAILDDVDHYSINFISDINEAVDNAIYDVLSDRE